MGAENEAVWKAYCERIDAGRLDYDDWKRMEGVDRKLWLFGIELDPKEPADVLLFGFGLVMSPLLGSLLLVGKAAFLVAGWWRKFNAE